MSDELLTLAQLADESGLSVSTLYRLCAPQGDLPVIRTQVGPGAIRRTRGRIRVRRQDWIAWQAKHRSTPAPSIERTVQQKSVADLPGASRYVS